MKTDHRTVLITIILIPVILSPSSQGCMAILGVLRTITVWGFFPEAQGKPKARVWAQ